MRLRVAIDGVDFSGEVELQSLTVTQDSTQAISTASLRVRQLEPPEKGAVGRYDVALYDEGRYGWAPDEWQEVRIWDGDTGNVLFGGFILGVQVQPAGRHIWYAVNCADYGTLLDRRLITQNWAAGTPDSQVLIEALAAVPELHAGNIITIVPNLGALEFKDQRVRDLFDAITQLTGGEYRVGYTGAVDYYQSGTIPAPFDLADDGSADGVGIVKYQLETYTHDFSDGANKVTVLGAIVNGVEVVGSAKDDSSIAQYGPLEFPQARRQIVDKITADQYAQSLVLERAFPKEILRVYLYKNGLTVGQTINVRSARLGLLAPYIIRTLEIVVVAPDMPGVTLTHLSSHILKYTASLGARPPDTVFQLRRMQRWPVESTTLPFSGATASFELPDGRTVQIKRGIVSEVK